jgi:hypothetical protein
VASLVLDEQFMSKRLIFGLTDRGLDVKTIGDFGAQGRADPDVVRRIAEGLAQEWVLVTMDLTILEDFQGFDWTRYAIAWIVINEHLQGSSVEKSKSNVVHRHAHVISEQKPGDHFTYTAMRHSKHPPSLTKLLGRKGGK